jgi:nucleotide-binding universal stress UspA family protein
MTGRVDAQWPRRILVPLDGSGLAESVLDEVRTLALAARPKVFLTTVVQTMLPSIMPWAGPTELYLESSEQREQLARKYLDDVRAQLAAEGFQVDARIASGSKVAREILRVAELERCDLVAIATHGAGGLDRVMFGSVTDQVVRHSHVPVLVIRPAMSRRGEPTLMGAGQEGGIR